MMITMENMCKSYRIAKKKHIYSISIPAYRENLKKLTELLKRKACFLTDCLCRLTGRDLTRFGLTGRDLNGGERRIYEKKNSVYWSSR